MRWSVDDLVAAALLGEGWQPALSGFASAAGARHAILMRNTLDRPVAILANEEAADAIADYLTGRIPPNSRYQKANLRKAGGFRVDHDDYSSDQLARDPYYQEFLRRHGVFWHANVVIAPGQGEYVELSLKRCTELGPYQPEDARALDVVLPDLYAAARIAKARLDAEARGMKWLLAERGDTILELDRKGCVLPGQAAGDAGRGLPFSVLAGRIVASDPTARSSVERAVATAVSDPPRMALAALTGDDGRRYLLQIHPVPGRARDVFLSASAIAVLIEREGDLRPHVADTAPLREAFGLTGREADVVHLLAGGAEIAAIARRLDIRLDTARTYLKDAFQKTGTKRQAELAALVARLGA